MRALVLLLLTAGVLWAGEPKREAGLSIHLLPDRVAKISGTQGGFTVTDPASKMAGKTYRDPKELVAYAEGLRPPVRENGLWIVTTHPSSYSAGEEARLKGLIALCAEKKIPVFTCRGSELPGGWKRAK